MSMMTRVHRSGLVLRLLAALLVVLTVVGCLLGPGAVASAEPETRVTGRYFVSVFDAPQLPESLGQVDSSTGRYTDSIDVPLAINAAAFSLSDLPLYDRNGIRPAILVAQPTSAQILAACNKKGISFDPAKDKVVWYAVKSLEDGWHVDGAILKGQLQPSVPVEPDEPEDPVTPDDPQEPTVPDNPQKPDEPATPDKPQKPSVDDPAKPSPEKPANPGKPESPDPEGTPGTPGKPEASSGSATPTSPAKPSAGSSQSAASGTAGEDPEDEGDALDPEEDPEEPLDENDDLDADEASGEFEQSGDFSDADGTNELEEPATLAQTLSVAGKAGAGAMSLVLVGLLAFSGVRVRGLSRVMKGIGGDRP
ncbi:MAG: hypothetical protein Q4D06_01960 [Coriobacteriia bacterium]|nr:hypothetical protein [Coriobacteriia bacterium]